MSHHRALVSLAIALSIPQVDPSELLHALQHNMQALMATAAAGGGVGGGIPIIFGHGGGGGGGLNLGALLGEAMRGGGGVLEAELARIFAASGARETPTARAVLESLPAAAIGAPELEAKAACAVCLCEYTSEEAGVVKMPCAHLFHRDCLTTWLSKQNTCPVGLARACARSPLQQRRLRDPHPQSARVRSPPPRPRSLIRRSAATR